VTARMSATAICWAWNWRNARTIASHNPAIFRQAAIGDYLLNGTEPETDFRAVESSDLVRA
jgi:hypothetical protein